MMNDRDVPRMHSFRRRTRSLIPALAFLGGCTVSEPAPATPIPPLGPHPRIFVSADELPGLRAQCLSGPKRARYQEIRRYAERELPGDGKPSLSHHHVLAWALVYTVEGDLRFGKAAVRGLMANVERGRWHAKQNNYWYFPAAYDLLHPLLQPAQIDSIARVVVERVRPRHLLKAPYYNLEANAAAAVFLSGAALAGDATSASLNRSLEAIVADGFDRFMGTGDYDSQRGKAPNRGGVIPTRLHHTGDGGFQKDRSYTSKDLLSLVHFAEVARRVGMLDAYEHARPYFQGVVDYLLWSSRPDGLGLRQTTGQGFRSAEGRLYVALAAIARSLRDGRAAWFIESPFLGDGGPATYDSVPFLLFWDPTVEPVAPSVENMGRHRIFGAEGLPHVPGTSSAERFVYRTGWDISGRSRDFLFHLDATDYLGDNPYWQVGGFEVFRRGALAIKSGYYHRIDDHYNRYHTASVASNTILIYDPAAGGTVDRGLQDNIRELFGRPDGLTALHDGSPYDRGGIDSVRVVVTGGREWVLVSARFRAEAVWAESKKARSWERRVAVSPGIAVIYDRIVPTNESAKLSWLLHTVEEPDVSGSVIDVDVPGEVTWHSGDSFRVARTVRYGSFPNGGVLHGKRLLPEFANTRKIGGEGYAFWVDDARPEPGTDLIGRNYEIDEPKARTTGREAGGWRLEIHSLESKPVMEFLVVLQANDGEPPDVIALHLDGEVAGFVHEGTTIGFRRQAGGSPFALPR